jgi:hypothetical protein
MTAMSSRRDFYEGGARGDSCANLLRLIAVPIGAQFATDHRYSICRSLAEKRKKLA